MIEFSIEPVELFLSIFLIALTILVIYAIVILRKTYLTIKELHKIVEDNKENIDKTMNEVPDLTKNITRITDEVAHGTEVFRGTVDNVADTTQTVSSKINGTVTESLASLMHTATIGKKAYDKVLKKNAENEE